MLLQLQKSLCPLPELEAQVGLWFLDGTRRCQLQSLLSFVAHLIVTSGQALREMHRGGSQAEAKTNGRKEEEKAGTLIVAGKGETVDGMRTRTGTTVLVGKQGAAVDRIAKQTQDGGEGTPKTQAT